MADDQLASDQATEARKAARPALVILMGTSGCGFVGVCLLVRLAVRIDLLFVGRKSTCGKQLAIRLGVSFIDGDDLHPEGNVVKMSRGEALTDQASPSPRRTPLTAVYIWRVRTGSHGSRSSARRRSR